MTILSRTTPREKLRRSNHARKCPVCGGSGCAQGGGITLCWRVESDRQARSGAFIHRDNDATDAPAIRAPRTEPLRASIERRHQIYSALLSVLPLHGRHADHLTSVRRLSEETITNSQFASVPSREDGDTLAREFAQHVALAGIPGFWRRFGEWVMSFSGTSGFFLPIRNLAGQIEALQIRKDDGKPKYLLFSSTDRPDGCSSGAPVHFARVGRDAVSVILTEGALKAEVIAEQLCAPVIGLVAVGTFRDSFGLQLRSELPMLRQVLIAFDQPEAEASDRARQTVALQLARLQKSLTAAGLHAEALTWEGAQKGFDDYLLEVAA